MQKQNLFLFFSAVAVNLMSFGSGIGYGWASPALPKLQLPEETPLSTPTTPLQDAWITSLMILGSSFGPFLSGYFSHQIGRKKTLLLFSIPILLSNVILTFARSIELMYVARFLVGFGTGAVFTVIPIYLAEISEDNNRGMLSCLLGIMLTLGNFFVFAIGPYVSISSMGILGIVPAVLFLVIFGFVVPESPFYLMLKNQPLAAEEALKKFRKTSNGDSIQKELLEMSRLLKDSEASKGNFRDLYRSKVVLKGLLITNGLFVFQQFSGVIGIMSYLQLIFDSTGSSLAPEICAMMVGLVQVVAMVITSQLVDKLGRRILLIVSCLGMCTSLLLMGTYFFLVENQYNVDSIFWLPVFSIMLYIITFHFGIGPIPWTIVGEIFPSNIKSLATTLTTTIVTSLCFLVVMFFQSYTLYMGLANSFWSFALCMAFAIVFVVVIVPETKGKSLQEIQHMLEGTK